MKSFSLPVLLLLLMLCQSAITQEKVSNDESSAKPAASDLVYYVQVRVIFSGETGIVGTVPRDLRDMSQVLKTSFKYPSYELSNTIRLSVFGDESATATVFPNHYLRLIPKGETKRGLKVKAEIYEVKEDISAERFFAQGDLNVSGVKENEEGSHSRVFPVMASAMLLTEKNWEAVGGVPVRVQSSGRVSSNSLSTSRFDSNQNPGGERKYLILGLQLENVVK